MARMYTGRYKVFSRYRSYHGSTMGAGNITGEPRRFACEPGLVGYVKFLIHIFIDLELIFLAKKRRPGTM